MSFEITSHKVNANGIDFTYLACGTGPLAFCLHGFPDSAHTWRHLMPALAHAGFRAIAPFTRGYAPTSLPADNYYQTGALAADVNALHQVLAGNGDAVLIGHDWGSATALIAGAFAPERWRRVVAMSVPPGVIMRRAFERNLEQLKRSWYVFYFQSALAETAIPANNYALIDMLWKEWSPDFESKYDVENFKHCVENPANLKAALGYYRASVGTGPRSDTYNDIQIKGLEPLIQPTLYLHGRKDGCIGVELAREAQASCPWLEVQILDQVGHFMQLEDPKLVNQVIVDWLGLQS